MFTGIAGSLLPEEGATMWFPSPLVLEQLVIRAIVVYALVLLLLRFTGKRQIGQLAPFDLVLLLMLSNAVQNALNGGDNSVFGGLLSVTFRSKRAEAFIEGHPLVLIHNGKLYDQMMGRAKVTHHELNAALRQAGCGCVEDVQYAVLENNGAISVVARKD